MSTGKILRIAIVALIAFALVPVLATAGVPKVVVCECFGTYH